MTDREAKERFWEISQMRDSEANIAKATLRRDMQQEADKGTLAAEWFKNMLAEYTISEYAHLIRYPGTNQNVRGRNLLADLMDRYSLENEKELVNIGRTWNVGEYPPVVEKRKKRGEYIRTWYGKLDACELASSD
jgi:hypothetical protein